MFQDFISTLIENFTPVIDSEILKEEYVQLDLSTGNQELNYVNIANAEEVQEYIDKQVALNQCKVAYGGYLEVRDIYKRSEYFNRQGGVNEERNIHLGIDIWSKAETKVLAPLDGVVHSFKNNTNDGDYGPTIILKHLIGSFVFYTLYGHLSIESIKKLEIGLLFKKGDKIGELGDSSVNGDYAPHLHFQVIIDLQGNKGDYPGVCSQKDLEFYKMNCPDPMLLLQIKSE